MAICGQRCAVTGRRACGRNLLALFVIVYLVLRWRFSSMNPSRYGGWTAHEDAKPHDSSRRESAAVGRGDDGATLDLPLLFAFVIAFALHVVGLDVRSGRRDLFLAAPSDPDRDIMMYHCADLGRATRPGWSWADRAHRSPFRVALWRRLLPAFYLPTDGLLFALIFRGVAFEFRLSRRPSLALMGLVLRPASRACKFLQGLILGAFIEGVPVRNDAFAGTARWLSSPFARPSSGHSAWSRLCRFSAPAADLPDRGDNGRLCPQSRSVPRYSWPSRSSLWFSLWTPIDQPEIAHVGFSRPNYIRFLWRYLC